MEKNSDKKQDNRKSNQIQEAGLLVLTVLLYGMAAFLYGKTQLEIVRIVIMAVIASGCVVFALEEGREKHSYLFDNESNLWRFSLIYLLFLAGSLVFPMLPAGGWPVLAAFVGLMLFSNQVIGMCAGSTLLIMTVMLGKDVPSALFLLYFVSGMAGMMVFSYLNESFRVWLPILISLMIQMVCLSIHEVLMVNEALTAELFLIPAMNSLVCLILLLIILKFFSFSIIYKHMDMYIDINDPECPLLVELKTFSKDEYYHAVHTAYLCDRIARMLNLDAAAAKAGGYYHKIGVLKGKNSWENVQEVLTDYRFPQKAIEVLKEYLDQDEKIISRETVVLMFSDTIISSISYLLSKEPENQLDYEKLIQAVFKKKIESGIIKYSHISFNELEEMKKIMIKEKLYYDFLR